MNEYSSIAELLEERGLKESLSQAVGACPCRSTSHVANHNRSHGSQQIVENCHTHNHHHGSCKRNTGDRRGHTVTCHSSGDSAKQGEASTGLQQMLKMLENATFAKAKRFRFSETVSTIGKTFQLQAYQLSSTTYTKLNAIALGCGGVLIGYGAFFTDREGVS